MNLLICYRQTNRDIEYCWIRVAALCGPRADRRHKHEKV